MLLYFMPLPTFLYFLLLLYVYLLAVYKYHKLFLERQLGRAQQRLINLLPSQTHRRDTPRVYTYPNSI